MKIRYIFVLLCLTVITRCQDGVTQATVEEVTEIADSDDEKTVNKRSSLLPSNPDGSVQENGVGFGSLVPQVIAAVFKGVLNSQGVTTDMINQAVALFSPDKILNDLHLLRRFLTLGLRLVTTIMGIVPFTSSGGFNPLQQLTSKVAFYTVEPSVQVVTFNGTDPMFQIPVPERVHTLVEYVTQRANDTASNSYVEGTATQSAEPNVTETVNVSNSFFGTAALNTRVNFNASEAKPPAPHKEYGVPQENAIDAPKAREEDMSIANLPLEQDSFDRRNKELRDSFGAPLFNRN